MPLHTHGREEVSVCVCVHVPLCAHGRDEVCVRLCMCVCGHVCVTGKGSLGKEMEVAVFK